MLDAIFTPLSKHKTKKNSHLVPRLLPFWTYSMTNTISLLKGILRDFSTNISYFWIQLTLYFEFQEKNQFAVSKYIWLIISDDINESFQNLGGLQFENEAFSCEIDDYLKCALPNIYIPYDCEFFLVLSHKDENNTYTIKEIYHPSFSSSDLFSHYFGTWKMSNGFEIDERDFYARRLNMNETIMYISSKYFVSLIMSRSYLQFLFYYFVFCCIWTSHFSTRVMTSLKYVWSWFLIFLKLWISSKKSY